MGIQAAREAIEKAQVRPEERAEGEERGDAGAPAVARDADSRLVLYSVSGGPARRAAGGPETALIIGCTSDGRSVFLAENAPGTGLAQLIYRRDLVTGRRELWKELRPRDQTGLVGGKLRVAAVGHSYAYDVTRCLSSLYLVEGLR